MNFLIDTQLAIWALFDGPQLSEDARQILDTSENRIHFSVCTIWEIAIKRRLNRADFQHDPRLIRRYLLRNGCKELTIQSEHAVEVDSLPPMHKNPFDRLLIAQAMVEGITLLTSDSVIASIQAPFDWFDSETYAVVLAQNSSNARTNSPAIICAVACSMTYRCIR